MSANRERDLLEILRDLIVIAAVFVFFAGFAYRYYYLNDLGIPAYIFPASIEETSAYAYSVFSTHGWYITVVFAIGVGGWWVVQQKRKVGESVRGAASLLVIALLLISFPVLNYWSQQTAFDDIHEKYQTTKPDRPIVLTFASVALPAYSSDIMIANQQGCLELVAENNDRLYIWVKGAGDPSQVVIAVPVRDLTSFETPIVYSAKRYATNCSAK